MSVDVQTPIKDWQRNRAILLDREFRDLDKRINLEGIFIKRGLKELARKLKGATVNAGFRPSRRKGGEPERLLYTLRLSASTLRREWDKWNAGGCSPDALKLDYVYVPPKDGSRNPPPTPLLISEIQRRCTQKSGGRDKHGLAPISVVYQWLRNDFTEGKPIPGINYADYPAGAEFPYSETTIRKYAPRKSERALGNVGFAAFKTRECYVQMDYSKLRKCELYTLDDARLDLLCVHHATARAMIVRIYVLMEVASRMIVSFLVKPMEAIRPEDVDELLANGLQTPGFGIGVGYTTYIKFERGATPCSEAAQAVLEGVMEGRLAIIRTGMNGGVSWTGAARDVASGNAAGKAVIESFIRRLHYALLHLPAQIGNDWRNTPASVGFGKKAAKDPLGQVLDDHRPGNLVAEAERLAKFVLLVRNANPRTRLKLQLPMLYLREVEWAVHHAIDKLNHEPGHEYADHGEFEQEEIAPGVWRECEPHGQARIEGGGSSIAIAAPPALPLPAILHPPSSKTYTLNGSAAPLTTKERNGIYWRLLKAAQAAQPDLNRFALTSRVLGSVKKIAQMTDDEFKKVCHVFESIAKKEAS